MKHYLKLLALPIFFLILYGSLFLGWEAAGLPSNEELAVTAEGWFDRYGLPAVFLSAIVEGMLVVGGYFPGVFIIFLGVILSDSIAEAAVIVIVVTLGLLCAHTFNYMLGKYGWYRLLVHLGVRGAIERAQARLENKGVIAVFLSYWLPSLAALTDTAAGIIQFPFKKFLIAAVIASTLWNILFATIVYILNEGALAIASPGASGLPYIIAVLLIWSVILLITDYFQRKKEAQKI